MAYGNNGNTLDAFWSTKKAVSYFEDVIDLDSNYYSAYGGIGIFEYALSYVPAFFDWALVLSGLSADQNNGFELIKLATSKGEIDRAEYQFHLSKLYDEHLAEYEQSLSLINPLLRKYPENALFHYQAAIEYIKSRMLDKAKEELEKVLQINHPKFLQTNSFSNFLLGDINFRQNNFDTALENYLIFLNTTRTIDYTGIASLHAAYCHYFLGNEKEFKRYALLAANGNLDLEEDKFAKETSLSLLEKGFSDEKILLIAIENSYLSGDEQKLLEIMESSLDSEVNENILAQALVYKSKILIDRTKLEEAKLILKKIDSLNTENVEWVRSMSLVNIAEISYLENDIEKSLEYLEDAEDSNDYQKKKYIQSLINGLKRKLRKTD